MDTGKRVGIFAIEHPRLIAVFIIGMTLVLAILAALPSIWPQKFESLHSLTIDTDPENMLPHDEPVRVFHDRMKKIMSLHDMIVVGIVNDQDKEHGVFNPDSLKKVYTLTQFAQGLRWRNPISPDQFEGVVEMDMIAPSMVDNVESGGAGVVRFEWLMSEPPETQEAASSIKRKAMDLPFLNGTLVSEDGKAVALYLPITAKDQSHRIYSALNQKIDNPSRLFVSELGNDDQVFRTLAKASRSEGDWLTQQVWQVLSSGTRRHILDAEKQIDTWRKALRAYERVSKGDSAETDKERARGLLKKRRAALESLVADLNRWMAEPAAGPWLKPKQGAADQLSDEGRRLLSRNGGTLKPEEHFRLKRLWLEAAFGDLLLNAPIPVLKGENDYHITGLPVAEDTFGVQMFKQMAISAPVALLIIFLLMWFFFRSALVILPAIYDAMIATTATMALLIITGNTIHIMSSMIPIFIVPIAVLDDVHVISEFFDRYQKTGDRRETIKHLMGDLFTPMLYTTLTTAVGFASLALAPIPPVQVFGLFVAFGVIVAWLCSILLVPAFISVLPKKVLDNFGEKHVSTDADREPKTLLGRVLRMTGRKTYRFAKPIVGISMAVLILSGYGISLIRVNDNPTKWFEAEHPIRVADRVLNDHFGGTYMAYLAFRPEEAPQLPEEVKPSAKSGKPSGGSKQSQEDAVSPALPGGLGNSPEKTGGPGEGPPARERRDGRIRGREVSAWERHRLFVWARAGDECSLRNREILSTICLDNN